MEDEEPSQGTAPTCHLHGKQLLLLLLLLQLLLLLNWLRGRRSGGRLQRLGLPLQHLLEHCAFEACDNDDGIITYATQS